MHIALDAYAIAPFGESEETALGNAGARHMVPRQTSYINKMGTPLRFDVRLPAVGVIRMRMGMSAKPDIDGTWVGSEMLFERLRIRLAIDEV